MDFTPLNNNEPLWIVIVSEYFLVEQHKQEVFTLCHDVANLRADAPLPIILIGDMGTGKTHLLYSIVSRISTSESATSIAYVTTNEIPLKISKPYSVCP